MTLEAQVSARKAELIAEIIEHKKNSCRGGAAAEVDRLRSRLTDLACIVDDRVLRGGNVDPKARIRLVEWMAR